MNVPPKPPPTEYVRKRPEPPPPPPMRTEKSAEPIWGMLIVIAFSLAMGVMAGLHMAPH